jgi:hypothetical protein
VRATRRAAKPSEFRSRARPTLRAAEVTMTTNVLVLCTHNSARSVLSEGMLDHWAKKLGKDVKAFSAGSAPSGRINPYALEALGNAELQTALAAISNS